VVDNIKTNQPNHKKASIKFVWPEGPGAKDEQYSNTYSQTICRGKQLKCLKQPRWRLNGLPHTAVLRH
jgi:hypothetical protein